MKRIQVLLLAALSATLLLTGCGKDKKTEEPAPDAVVDVQPETDAEAEPEEVPDTPPAEGMVRSRLTNEWVDGKLENQRPIAVMIPNEAAAIPHYGLAEVSVLYECNVEGRMTRLLAIFEDWENMEKIGNIRSLRDYYIYWALEWDPFICHFGGPYYIDTMISQSTTENIDGTGSGGNAYFRSSDRKAPHNAYATGADIAKTIDKLGYSREYRGLADDSHYQFTTPANPNTLEQYTDAISASTIDMSGCYPLSRTYFEYNAEDGLYYRSQHLSGGTDGPHIDGASGKQLAFKNILIQNTYYETRDAKGYLAFQCHDTTRDGWYFTNGKGIHVTWKKTTDFGATRYYDDNGEEIVLNTGKTMVCIVEDGDEFSYK